MTSDWRSLEFVEVSDQWSILEGFLIVKCLDEDGDVTWAFRATEGLGPEELLGALTIRTDLLRRDLLAQYTPD